MIDRLIRLLGKKPIVYGILSIIVMTAVLATGGIVGVSARTEQTSDASNNNLIISMNAPDYWNSGTVSQTVANLNWRLNGLNAMNDDMSAFFIVVNSPSIMNIALPLTQKTGILSLVLSQYVTINKESDLTLSDGSSGHLYSISISPEQLHRLKAPVDKGFDGVLITTKQLGTTYIVAYASEMGKMSQFESVFQNILNSVKFGSVAFSNTGNTFTSPENTNPSNFPQQPVVTQAPEPNPTENPMTNMTGNMTGGNATAGGAYVTIVPGSSSPSNGKNFVPDTLPVSKGTTVTWMNEDTTLHTVTSGTPEGGNSGTEFDSSYIAAGKTFEHTFNTAGTFDYYCTLHPFMKGKIVVS
jgi:plastocyanin